MRPASVVTGVTGLSRSLLIVASAHWVTSSSCIIILIPSGRDAVDSGRCNLEIVDSLVFTGIRILGKLYVGNAPNSHVVYLIRWSTRRYASRGDKTGRCKIITILIDKK